MKFFNKAEIIFVAVVVFCLALSAVLQAVQP